MELFAAVDVMGGRAVRLVRGELGAPRSFGDPLDVARRFLAAGAPWLHVVDLDAARTGAPVNRTVVLSLAEEAHRAGARVEVGGGVRRGRDVDELLAAGVDRVVLGTVAIEEPDAAARHASRHPGKVAVGLDYRRAARGGGLELALRGWTQRADADPAQLLGDWAGVPFAAVVVTAIDRDGTRQGPDTDGLSWVLDATALPVVASGGVGSAADLSALAGLRSGSGRSLAGAVVGRALVDGSIEVEEAVAACAASG